MNQVKRMMMDLKGRFGLTQNVVAAEAGIDVMTLSSWITGRYQPQGAKFEKFREVYLRYMGDEHIEAERARGDRDSTIIAMHYRGYPHPEIGELFGISRERVRAIVKAHGEAPRRR